MAHFLKLCDALIGRIFGSLFRCSRGRPPVTLAINCVHFETKANVCFKIIAEGGILRQCDQIRPFLKVLETNTHPYKISPNIK